MNGRAVKAVWGVILITIVSIVVAAFVGNERVAIIFAFVTPTIGILLVIAQNKEIADKSEDTRDKAAKSVEMNRILVADKAETKRQAREKGRYDHG